MKKTKLKQIGKIGRRNIKANNTLKWIYIDYGITKCEVRLKGCMIDNYLTFAHRHKRDWYKSKENILKLAEFNQTVLACVSCHDKMEGDRELTEKVFKKLRPKTIYNEKDTYAEKP